MNLTNYYKPLPDIGLFGKTRSGKDTIYNALDFMGFDCERVAFGDIMKERFFQTFPHIPKEPKPIAQQIAYGEAMRTIDTHVWVKPTMNRVKLRSDILAQAGLRVPTFVYTDIRNSFEYDAVKNTGAVMVKVEATEELRAFRMAKLGEKPSEEIFNAPTEVALDSFEYDYVIYNNGDMEDLSKQIHELIYQIQLKRGNE